MIMETVQSSSYNNVSTYPVFGAREPGRENNMRFTFRTRFYFSNGFADSSLDVCWALSAVVRVCGCVVVSVCFFCFFFCFLFFFVSVYGQSEKQKTKKQKNKKTKETK